MKRNKLTVLCVALFTVVLSLGSQAFAQSKVSVYLQHWSTNSSGSFIQLSNNNVGNMYWPGGSFGSRNGGSKEFESDDSARFNFGYNVYGYATFYYRSPFAQEWNSPSTYVERAMSNQTFVNVAYIENYYHKINVLNANGYTASNLQHGKRFGKSGYGSGSPNNSAFLNNTVDITNSGYFPFIGMGTPGAYSLYIINKGNNSIFELPMSGNYYNASGIYNLTFTLAATRAATLSADASAEEVGEVVPGSLKASLVESSVDRITEYKNKIKNAKVEKLTSEANDDDADADAAVKSSDNTSKPSEKKVEEKKKESKKENGKRDNTKRPERRERKATNSRR